MSSFPAVQRTWPRAGVKQKTILKSAIFTLGAVCLLWAAVLAWHGIRLAITLNSLKGQLDHPYPAQIAKEVHSAAADLGAVRAAMLPLYPVLKIMQLLPGVGPAVAQSPYLLDYAAGLAQAGDDVLGVLAPLLSQRAPDASAAPISERALQRLRGNQASFDRATAGLLLAARARPHIDASRLPARFQPIFAQVDHIFHLAGPGLELLNALPDMLGQDTPANYLILAQNRDELRPTGGFISGIGVIQYDRGRLAKFDMGDSYRIDDFSKGYPRPPEPIQRFMLAGYWVTRDANWSPDFPTSARQAQKLYTLSTGVQTCGVIAFDQSAVRAILKATGPVHLANFSEPVSEANIEQFMQQAWESNGQETLSKEWWEHRKDFMKELGGVLLQTLTQNLDAKKAAQLLVQGNQLLQQGHLLLYFNDPRAEEILSLLEMNGAIRMGTGDYLQLVDTNMGFNKVDSLIHRSLVYSLDFRDLSRPTARLTASYVHSGKSAIPCKQEASYGNGTYQDMQARCYWDYWRMYTAGGNRLVEAQSPSVPAGELLNGKQWPGGAETLNEEGGARVFGGMLVLQPAAQQQFALQFALSPEMLVQASGDTIVYHLRIAKQAGIDSLPVTIHVVLPQNASPLLQDGWSQSEGGLAWQGRLTATRDFALTFRLNH